MFIIHMEVQKQYMMHMYVGTEYIETYMILCFHVHNSHESTKTIHDAHVHMYVGTEYMETYVLSCL